MTISSITDKDLAAIPKGKPGRRKRIETDSHIINEFAAQLVGGLMGKHEMDYWSLEARRKGVSLQHIVEHYLIKDFRIDDPNFKYSE